MFSIEKNIPLSQSRLWQAQRDFFNREGINAWQGQVPFFVTSNPFIAECYAKLIIAYLRDLLLHQALDFKDPLYIFELGTGSGQFSFYCIKALKEKLALPEFENLKLCYVLTDFTASNIQFWEQQSAFKTLQNSSLQIDFAEFDLEHPTPITLRRQSRRLETLQNPCILIGNYIFDSVKQNFYAMEDGKLIEKRIETFLPTEQYDFKTKEIRALNGARIEERPIAYEWGHSPSEEPYLHFYHEHLQQGLFSLPIGGFAALDFFHTYAPQGFVLISSDKGYNTLTEMSHRQNLELVTHGSFSLDVNFHALSLYFQNLGGQSLLQSYREGMKTNVFLSPNFAIHHLKQAYQETCETLSPADYFQYHRRFRERTELDLELLLTQFHLSRYDPYVFSMFVHKLCDAFLEKPQSKALIDAYCQMIPHFFAHIYPLPQGMDHYFNLGLFLHTLEHYAEAMPYFEASIAHYGESFSNLYNLGVCKYMTKAFAEAKACFEKAKLLEMNNERKAEKWLKQL